MAMKMSKPEESEIKKEMVRRARHKFAAGVVHRVPEDLRQALTTSTPAARTAWRILRHSRAMSGSVGLNPPRNQRRGAIGSREREMSLEKECAGLVVGPVAFIVEISH